MFPPSLIERAHPFDLELRRGRELWQNHPVRLEEVLVHAPIGASTGTRF
jgi:hypothetical protein